MMIKYEIKKVFSRTSSKIALLGLAVVLVITCFSAVDVKYVTENGDSIKGPEAISKLKSAQKAWSGNLDEEKIRQSIEENRRISQTPEALSNNQQDNEIAYSWGQGISEIRNLMNRGYASGFTEYDYYRADSLSGDDAMNFYSNRIALLKEWLNGPAVNYYSDQEKQYLIEQYEDIQTPFYYNYIKGWTQLFDSAPTIVMIIIFILGYLVSGIFSGEFTWKSDAIFFTSVYGRNKAVSAKIKAGVCITTAVYWGVMLLYTAILLLYFGTDGWQCPVQISADSWKCFYNITVLQKYFLIAIGGYIGCLFISLLCMLVSAKTKSTVIAVIIPFVLIFIPSFLTEINSPVISKVLGLLPDQLSQTGKALDYFNLYSFGGKVYGAVPLLMLIYMVLTVVVCPVIYHEYRYKQIR